MKLQYLSIIFLIIILPIVMVLSQYIDYNIDAINLRHEYDTKLINSTYDALKSYQINTVNNAISDIPASKINELEAAVNTFFNSVSTNFDYMGNNTQSMKEYIPAVVFTLYDGYYIYSPFENVLTGVKSDDVDSSYVKEDGTDGKTLYGLKPYVYYSCKYKKDSGSGKDFDVVITYTLDNYITIQGEIEQPDEQYKYYKDAGYLIDGIKRSNKRTITIEGKQEDVYDYEYDGIKFTYENRNECLVEFLGEEYYPYAKINGTKYYLDKSKKEVFYINGTGERATQASNNQNKDLFEKYEKFITENNSAYRYYRDSYEFTKRVRENLSGLKTSHAVDSDTKSNIQDFGDFEIFGEDTEADTTGNGTDFIQDSNSLFNMHRAEVIRYVVTKNLSSAIAGYKNFYNSTNEYIMPKISESDWETIENNISMITFLQGFKIAGRDYNEYCVVANNLNKEFVSEDDIYVLGDDKTYYKVKDTNLNITDSRYKNPTMGANYYRGVWKLNFENKIFLEGESDTDYKETKYYPISYKSGGNTVPYIGSYSSIIASTSVDTSESDMYKYMRNLTDGSKQNIKTTYYTALARERWGQYSVNNDTEIFNIQDLAPDPTPPTPTPDPTPPTPDPTPPSPTPDPGLPTEINDLDGNTIVVILGRMA